MTRTLPGQKCFLFAFFIAIKKYTGETRKNPPTVESRSISGAGTCANDDRKRSLVRAPGHNGGLSRFGKRYERKRMLVWSVDTQPPLCAFRAALRRARRVTILRWLALCSALLATLPARAQSEAQLVRLINEYRAAPQSCEGRKIGPAGALAPHPALARIRLAPGTLLQPALETAGYPSEHAEAIAISGAPDPQTAMATIQYKYCRTLLSAQFSAVGATRTGDNWVIVLAQPSPPPPTLPEWTEAGKAILEAVNAARASARICGDQSFAAAPALTWNAALGAAALAHSRDMANQRYFSHQGKDGKLAGERARQADYRWRNIGENIAVGMRTPEDAIAGWLTSPGHCANIMNPRFTEMGAAYGVSYARPSGTVYWTQVFGAPL